MDYKKKGKLNNIVVFSKAFLSFSETETQALNFLGKSNNNFLGILFVLENNNQNNQESNADIQNFSAFKNEKRNFIFSRLFFYHKRN